MFAKQQSKNNDETRAVRPSRANSAAESQSVSRTSDPTQRPSSADVIQMQQTHGNAFVRRHLESRGVIQRTGTAPVGVHMVGPLSLGLGNKVIETRPGSQAEGAGLQPDDVIFAVNGNPVPSDLNLFDGNAPGDQVTLDLYRPTYAQLTLQDANAPAAT